MAVLDRYLEALRMPGAQAITFKSGMPVEILANNATRTVNNAVPTADQLLSILSEVLPPEFRTQGAGASKDYPYTSPFGLVKINVQMAAGKDNVRFGDEIDDLLGGVGQVSVRIECAQRFDIEHLF